MKKKIEWQRYHILRLLFEIKRMLTQQDLKVFLDGWEHDVLVNVRNESMSKVSNGFSFSFFFLYYLLLTWTVE